MFEVLVSIIVIIQGSLVAKIDLKPHYNPVPMLVTQLYKVWEGGCYSIATASRLLSNGNRNDLPESLSYGYLTAICDLPVFLQANSMRKLTAGHNHGASFNDLGKQVERRCVGIIRKLYNYFSFACLDLVST